MTNPPNAETIACPQTADTNALDVLSDLVANDMKRVNETIVQRMQSPVALIPQLAGHLVAAGGKRLRPMLTLASARLCGYEDGEDHIRLATCVEFIHTATLLHDDVVDESVLRRGQASANALFGNKPSVLVGDFLFSRAFELMVEVGNLPVLGILSRASAVIAEGEVQQLITTNDIDTSEESYLEVISGKTAELFAAACKVGAEVAGRTHAEASALYAYGMALGLAFQIVDDCLDYSANQERLGKTVGDDFREGKITLPVILALQQANSDERAFWSRTLGELQQNEGDLGQAMALMKHHGALEATAQRAREYGEQAKEALKIFPPSPMHQALRDIVGFCISRAW
ncbi:polyprenyl synthetase family protein [Haematospirillum sp. H1815]|uniref:polyprenyl synthetase family protein n=1 Tax=Haematospirillum sp. H1815 TaxID=2723108 RepID=UPI0039F7344C